ncbi:MAG: hypothetical protein JWM88_530 [Verrucomicrobia bacterium]|nr:hypothetical protein [Verrucomicrobiota bacterium]
MKKLVSLVLLSVLFAFIVSGVTAAGMILVCALTAVLALISFRRSARRRRAAAQAKLRAATTRRSPPPSYVSR